MDDPVSGIKNVQDEAEPHRARKQNNPIISYYELPGLCQQVLVFELKSPHYQRRDDLTIIECDSSGLKHVKYILNPRI